MRCELAARDTRHIRFKWAALGDPAIDSAIEQRDFVMAVIAQEPPQAPGCRAPGIVVGDHVRVVTDARVCDMSRENFR